MAQILRDKLLSSGYDVLMLRDSEDVQLDNVARTVICNNVADCHIALHWDSGDGKNYDKGCFYISVPEALKTWSRWHRTGSSTIPWERIWWKDCGSREPRFMGKDIWYWPDPDILQHDPFCGYGTGKCVFGPQRCDIGTISHRASHRNQYLLWTVRICKECEVCYNTISDSFVSARRRMDLWVK